MTKVYIKNHSSFAGKWIYNGYASAWKCLGYDVVLYDELSKIEDLDYYLMAVDSDVSVRSLNAIDWSRKTFLFIQPNSYPEPWGKHPNFVCRLPDPIIDLTNRSKKVVKWTFAEVNRDYYHKWQGDIHTIPLAFDSINYRNLTQEQSNYDVCFVGGFADNGFGEKKKIMVEIFTEFQKKQSIKCGFFGMLSPISHDAENIILSNSRVTLNIHDAYQRSLKLDTNERTFKSLGLNGCLLTDDVGQTKKLFKDKCFYYYDNEDLIDKVENLLNTSYNERESKENNRQFILENHTYIQRVNTLLSL